MWIAGLCALVVKKDITACLGRGIGMFEVSSCRLSGLSYWAQARDYPNLVNPKTHRGRLPSCLAGLTVTHSLGSLTKKKQLSMISIMLNPLFSTSEVWFLTRQTPDHFLEGKTVKSLYLETIPLQTPVKRRVNAAIKRRVNTFICSPFSSLDWEAHERKRSGIKSKELSSLRMDYMVSSASLSQYWLTVAVCLPSRSLPC